MSTNKFLTILTDGLQTLVTAISSSSGGSDANKIIATDGSGKLDSTFLPTGLGPDTVTIEATENLAAGDFINIHDSTGPKVRKADGSNARAAHGFVLASVTSGQNATVYRSGVNSGLTSLTPGAVYWLSTATAGAATATAPTQTSGHINQVLGIAESTTSISFEYNAPIAFE